MTLSDEIAAISNQIKDRIIKQTLMSAIQVLETSIQDLD